MIDPDTLPELTDDPRARAMFAIGNLEDREREFSRVDVRDLSGFTERGAVEFVARTRALPDERRRQVFQAMVELAEDNVDLIYTPYFRAALRDPDPEIRRAAVEGLWESDDARVAEGLIDLALRDRDVAVRAVAASGLGRFAYRHELGQLESALGERLRDALLALFENDREPVDVRRRALESLAFMSGDDVHDLIVEAYRHGDDKLRASSIFAMGRSCDPAWMEVLLRELRNPSSEFRFEAARACGDMEDSGAVPELINLLRDPDRDVRFAAVASLGRIGGSQAKRALVAASRGSDSALAAAADEALDELNFGEDPIGFRLGGRASSN